MTSVPFAISLNPDFLLEGGIIGLFATKQGFLTLPIHNDSAAPVFQVLELSQKILNRLCFNFLEKTSSSQKQFHSEKPIKKVSREELIAGHLWY